MKTPKRRFIDLTPVREEVLTNSEFVRIAKSSPELIERSRFIAPRIGGNGFGRFSVRYYTPILKHKEAA